MAPKFSDSTPQSGTHILAQAFFKHALENNDSRNHVEGYKEAVCRYAGIKRAMVNDMNSLR